VVVALVKALVSQVVREQMVVLLSLVQSLQLVVAVVAVTYQANQHKVAEEQVVQVAVELALVP
jgi:hypothetical protein